MFRVGWRCCGFVMEEEGGVVVYRCDDRRGGCLRGKIGRLVDLND